MDYKQNTEQNHEQNSQTLAAGQPAPAASTYRQLFLALLFVLQNLMHIVQQLKDDCMLCWFELQTTFHSIPNLMKRRTSPLGDDHDDGKNREEFNMQKHKPKDDKENDINMVGQSSDNICGVCLDFKAESDVVRDKCKSPFCVDNIYKHVATQIQQLKDDSVQFKLELKRIANMMPNLMKRTTPDQDHDRGKKEESHRQKQKQNEEDKVNNIEMNEKSSKCYCGICLDFKAESDMFRRGNKCNHPFCSDCISKHVAAQIQQNILKVNCPNPSCGVELTPQNLMSTLPKDVIDRWESAKYESSIALPQKVYCPFKNCSVLLVNDDNKGKVVMTSCECPYCHRLFCAQCKVPWHAEMSCKEFQKSKKNKGEKDFDKKFLELAKVNKWPKCPNCSFYVQRRSGCEHMTCRCGCNFCYKCGKKWKFGHICK